MYSEASCLLSHPTNFSYQVIALEAQRDLSRVILHADMDMFYAAVELKRDPTLKGKAFGVGSGVLVTASYEARKMGCRSGMATHVALALCPHLIVVKNDMASYVSASKEVMAIFEQYDPDYAQMSLDEAYMDITPYCEQNETNADAVVAELRQRVLIDTGLTVSVGIAPNKMLAKISSDRNKPNGQFRVEPNRNFIINLMQDLPCRKIPGIGRVTERILSSLDVNTCGDIWTQRTLLSLVLGEIDWLLNAYLGIHSNVVEPSKRGERRSVGREHTFSPTKDPVLLKEYLKQSADKVAEDLQRLDYRGKCITLTCKTDTFRRFTRAKTVTSHLHRADDLFAVVIKLLDAEFAAQGGPFSMRLIGVRVSALIDIREPEQGGIKKMFEQVKSGGKPKAKLDEGDDAADLSFEAAMQRALEQSALDHHDMHLSRSTTPLETDYVPMNTDNTALTCPVCQRAIDLPSDVIGNESLMNTALNQHIDLCLSGEIPKKRQPLPVPSENKQHKLKKHKHAGPTLDRFFKGPV